MPKKRLRKKTYSRKKFFGAKTLLSISALLVSLFVAVAYLQQQQTIRQFASTETSNVTKPVYGCIGLGGSFCASNVDTFLSDPTTPGNTGQNECLAVDKATMEPALVAAGQEITGTIVVRNKCFEGEEVPILFLKAAHASGKEIIFKEESTFQSIIKDQTVTFTTKYTISPDDPTGEWAATFFTRNGAQEIPFSNASSNLKFTVEDPCPGLEVSKKITLDKLTVDVNETITGSITYRNPCPTNYVTKSLIIQARDAAASVSDFTNTTPTDNITFTPGQEVVVEASRTIKDTDPKGLWKAFGAYQKGDGQWVVDDTQLSFTVGAAANGGQCNASTPCPNGQTCYRGGVCRPAVPMGGACETSREIIGTNPGDTRGIHGTCQEDAFCITDPDTSAKCKDVGDCVGTCQAEPRGIMNGQQCRTANKQDTQGGCINGSKCDVSADTAPACTDTGACTGTCTLNEAPAAPEAPAPGAACDDTKPCPQGYGCDAGVCKELDCHQTKPCPNGQTCYRGGVCRPAVALGGACETSRAIIGTNWGDPRGIHGTCQAEYFCITDTDNSPQCKSVGDCVGTCKVESGGIMNGQQCKTANKQDVQGGCINGSRCDFAADASPACRDTGACTGTCVLQ